MSRNEKYLPLRSKIVDDHKMELNLALKTGRIDDQWLIQELARARVRIREMDADASGGSCQWQRVGPFEPCKLALGSQPVAKSSRIDFVLLNRMLACDIKDLFEKYEEAIFNGGAK